MPFSPMPNVILHTACKTLIVNFLLLIFCRLFHPMQWRKNSRFPFRFLAITRPYLWISSNCLQFWLCWIMDVWILRAPPLTRMVGCRGPRIGVCWSRWGGRGSAPSRPLPLCQLCRPPWSSDNWSHTELRPPSSAFSSSSSPASPRWRRPRWTRCRQGGCSCPGLGVLRDLSRVCWSWTPPPPTDLWPPPCSGSSAPPSPPPAHTLKALWLENSDARANKKTNTNTSQDTNTQTKAKTRNCTHPQGSAGQELKCRSLTLCHHQHRHMSDSKRFRSAVISIKFDKMTKI